MDLGGNNNSMLLPGWLTAAAAAEAVSKEPELGREARSNRSFDDDDQIENFRWKSLGG